MKVEQFISRLRSSSRYREQIVHVEHLPKREPEYARLEPPLPSRVRAILSRLGIEKLYVHQVSGIDHVRNGRDVVVVTGTASGKTLVYNVPMLENLLSRPDACALYLFPTKALAQDQLRTLKGYLSIDPALALTAGTYDGDTPPQLRRKLKNEANVLLTNPDMLHAGILPNHGSWARFFSRLELVVVDEIHSYRGVFGSNVSHVLNRLNRICAHYGSRPVYICCSATIRNPLELAEKLTGRKMHVVDRDGSPRGEKTFLFWNPPYLDDAHLERKSSNVEAAGLLSQVVSEGVQAIVFVRARVVSEVITKYAREELAHIAPSLSTSVKAYRGGYLPEERRAIEKALFDGELKAVVSTNALELGIDVGALDASILVGYPGTIASTWQQAGRAGRGSEPSLVVLVPYESPIDQYMVHHPDYFFGRSPESAVIDPQNPHVVLSHLRSAAFELPIDPHEWGFYGEYCGSILKILEEEGQLRSRRGRYYWCGGTYPSTEVPLRNIGDSIFTIIEEGEKNRVIGTIDEASAHMQIHPEAIYMHDGETYFVRDLDLNKKVAFVEKMDSDYYTQSMTEVKINVDSEETTKEWRKSQVSFGKLSVTSLTFMFKKVKFGSRDSLGYGALDLPPIELLTNGMWVIPPVEAYRYVREAGRVPREGLLGISNVVKEVIPLFAMCDTMDIGSTVDSSAARAPAVFVYDRYPGGLGFSMKAFEMVDEVMEAALELIESCPCGEGCPSCVGSPLPPFSQVDADVSTRGLIPDKESARSILHFLLEREPYIPSIAPKRGERPEGRDLVEGSLETKPFPFPVEKKLRERISKMRKRP